MNWLFLCLSFLLCFTANAAESPRIKQPVDQTDVFAIPLDEDEESQDEELQQLEHPKK